MDKVVMLLVCSFYVLPVLCEVTLKADRPFLSIKISHEAVLECCFTTSGKPDFVWVKSFQAANKTVKIDFVQNAMTKLLGADEYCGVLTLTSAKIADQGFYQCYVNASKRLTHGTYLQVYKPLEKTIRLTERTKNIILTVEGIMLFCCVILPSAILLFKSKNINELEKKKATKEEENIYQGLDLDECCSAYDQIERLQGQGPYDDVGNNEDDIQLEKP